MVDRAAILIVNGGRDPEAGRWIELCLDQIARHTSRPGTTIHVWNNNVDDAAVPAILDRHPGARLVQADPAERLAHPHAVPLQRLYEEVRGDVRWIVTLDSDAFPIRSGWLDRLIDGVARHGIGGVWRDELRRGIVPYVHASCLCTSVEFIEQHGLRLDHVEAGGGGSQRLDTLGLLTKVARESGMTPYKWRRSNRREIHRLIGGVYGDWIYHHGAGSRVGVGFWDEIATEERQARNRLIRDRAASLVFCHRERYLSWLRGGDRPDAPERIHVVGMPESGADWVARCIEEDATAPAEVESTDADTGRRTFRRVRAVRVRPGALGDGDGARPEPGSVGAPGAPAIGVFRDPADVPHFLERGGDDAADARALWERGSEALLEMHLLGGVPLLPFDVRAPGTLLRRLLHAFQQLGLQPDLDTLPHLHAPETKPARAPQGAPAFVASHAELLERALPAHSEDGMLDAVLDIWAAQAGSARDPAGRTAAQEEAPPRNGLSRLSDALDRLRGRGKRRATGLGSR